MIVGGANAARSKHAWRQVYRALEHKLAVTACKDNLILKFPGPIIDFANTFVSMQAKRHLADYDPFIKLAKSEVVQDIATARQTMQNFAAQPLKDRKAFCTFIILKRRPV